jgi:hypothetical protein
MLFTGSSYLPFTDAEEFLEENTYFPFKNLPSCAAK